MLNSATSDPGRWCAMQEGALGPNAAKCVALIDCPSQTCSIIRTGLSWVRDRRIGVSPQGGNLKPQCHTYPARCTTPHMIKYQSRDTDASPRGNFVLTKDRKRPYYRHFCGKIHRRRGLVVKRPGVLSKVQMLNLVLGVGVFSLLPNNLLLSGTV